MELTTITNISRTLDVSTRTLRYYEQIGLIESTRKPDYSYRVYDEENILKIQQIIILRKLDISLKNIKQMLQNEDIKTAIHIFQERITEINNETDSLNTVKSILEMLIEQLTMKKELKLSIEMLTDETVGKILESSTLLKNNLKENKTMSDLNKSNEILTKLDNVRILHIPSFTVASSNSGVCKNPEQKAIKALETFITDSKLLETTKDIRVFGFNNPSPQANEDYGYEFWVTIPENFEVTEPLTKRHFEGGLYAAHCIKMGDFHEWQYFSKWVEENKEYTYEAREPKGMFGSLEEHLNAYSFYSGEDKGFTQLDLLIPIKKIK